MGNSATAGALQTVPGGAIGRRSYRLDTGGGRTCWPGAASGAAPARP